MANLNNTSHTWMKTKRNIIKESNHVSTKSKIKKENRNVIYLNTINLYHN